MMIDLVPKHLRDEWINQGIYPNLSIYEMFYKQLQKKPNKAAIISLEEIISYSELNGRIQDLVNNLILIGIHTGDVIAYQLRNSWKSIAIDLACAALGATVLPIPPKKDKTDIHHMLMISRASTFIFEDNDKNISLIESIQPNLPELKYIIINSKNNINNYYQFDRLWNNSVSTQNCSIGKRGEFSNLPARFILSSGTESTPKLVSYSHNILIGGRGQFICELTNYSSETKALYLPPLGTAFGSSATVGVIACLGGTLITIYAFDVEKTIECIEKFGVTHIFGVPTMYQRIIANEKLELANKENLIAIISGGSIIDKTTIERCIQGFKCQFVSLYGSADGMNCYTSLGENIDVIVQSVGKPNPSICTIKIIDEHGSEILDGEIGEVICRGPNTPLQYVNSPELDKKYRDEDGWVYTGDLGMIDKDGYLRLCGRKKDIIIRGGLNISPSQIEKLVVSHPEILGCVCFPVKDSDVGERVGLCIMIKNSYIISLAEIRRYLERHELERSKLPDYLFIVKELPLNETGKVDKEKIRNLIDSDFVSLLHANA